MTRALHVVRPGEGDSAPGAAAPLAPLAPIGVLDSGVRFALVGSELSAGAARQHLGDHVRVFGARPSAVGSHGAELLDAITTIGLTGRGGGHFPLARKWRTALAAGGGGTVVVNGAESESCSAKDAALLQLRPHLVLDGAVSAAETMAARSVVVWLHDGASTTRLSVEQALAERREAGVVDPPIVVRSGPAHYLTGESSAVVQALSGGPALPAFRRVPSAVSGVDGRPTLVSNVETFARTALAARTGVAAYRPATLVTVVGRRDRLVLDVPPSATFDDLVGIEWSREHGVPAAALLGGYGGTWVTWSQIGGLPVHEPALRAEGHTLGPGIVVPLPAGACGLAETARIVDYLASSSARQCGPCMFGLRAVADLVGQLAEGSARRSDLARLRRFAGEVDGRGGCSHPDGAVRLVTTALHTFSADVRQHVHRHRCLHARTAPVVPVPSGA